MSILFDIRSLLTGINSDIYMNDIPDTPNNCLFIYGNGSNGSIYKLGGRSYEQFGFNVEARNASYETAYDEIKQVKSLLDSTIQQTINDTIYMSFYLQENINSNGRDNRERIRLSLRYIAFIQRNKGVDLTDTLTILDSLSVSSGIENRVGFAEVDYSEIG